MGTVGQVWDFKLGVCQYHLTGLFQLCTLQPSLMGLLCWGGVGLSGCVGPGIQVFQVVVALRHATIFVCMSPYLNFYVRIPTCSRIAFHT